MPDENKIEKRIDGLKASSEQIANSRKIVLESIGENENTTPEKGEKKYALDGLARKSVLKSEAANLLEAKKEEQRKEYDLNIKKDKGLKFIDSINLLNATDDRLDRKKKTSIEKVLGFPLKKTIKKEVKKEIVEEKPLKAKPEKKAEEKKAEEKKADLKQIDKKEKEKQKKELIEKNIKEKAQKKAERRDKLEKSQKALLNFFKQTKNSFKKNWEGFKKDFWKYTKKALFMIIAFFLVLLFFYFGFVLFIIKTDFDKPIARTISRHIPLPAFIVKGKVIDYYFWQDIKKQAEPEEGESLEAAARKDLAQYLAMNELAKRYSLPSIAFSEIKKDAPMKDLAAKALSDEVINQVAINRIRSIKKMIDEKNDFVRVSEKYGDELGKTTILSEDKEELPYYKKLENLEVGAISEIVVADNGYYIFRCFEKNEKEQILSYVLVKNENFDKYLKQMIEGYKFISFVD